MMKLVVDRDAVKDGYVSWMLYALCNRTFRQVVGSGPRRHVVGTRLSPEVHGDVTMGDIEDAKSLLEPVVERYSVVIKTEMAGKEDELIIAAFAPIRLSEEEFTAVVEAFKSALHEANVLHNPMDCPLPAPANLRSVK